MTIKEVRNLENEGAEIGVIKDAWTVGMCICTPATQQVLLFSWTKKKTKRGRKAWPSDHDIVSTLLSKLDWPLLTSHTTWPQVKQKKGRMAET